jgi:hypothetical protein
LLRSWADKSPSLRPIIRIELNGRMIGRLPFGHVGAARVRCGEFQSDKHPTIFSENPHPSPYRCHSGKLIEYGLKCAHFFL